MNNQTNCVLTQKTNDVIFRKRFLEFVGNSYIGIRRLKFKKYSRFFTVRGHYGRRSLWARGFTVEEAAERFIQEIKHKVILSKLIIDRRYGSLDCVFSDGVFTDKTIQL